MYGRMEHVHMSGGHRDLPRPRCPLCQRKRKNHPYLVATNRPNSTGEASVRPGFGYCTPAGIR